MYILYGVAAALIDNSMADAELFADELFAALFFNLVFLSPSHTKQDRGK